MKRKLFCHTEPSPGPCIDAGPLWGKRAAVQCTISVKGWPTEAGSRALRGFVALEDATVVERLKSAGATLLGSMHTPELGLGPAPDGMATAFKDGSVDLLLMTDTMGEARLAAASAGVFGLKPSYGRVSRFGLVGLVPSMDSCGILGKSLEDVGTAFKAIEGADDRDPSMGDGAREKPRRKDLEEGSRLTAGIVLQSLAGLDADARAAFSEALGKVAGAGIEVLEIQWEDFDLLRAVHNVIGSVEASSSCGKYDGVRYGHCAAGSRNWNDMYLQSRSESFGLLLKTYLFQGAYFQFENYKAFEHACRLRAKLVEESSGIFRSLDFLLLPTKRGVFQDNARDNRPQTVERVYDAGITTLPANVTGNPALTLPGLVRSVGSGGDLGLQLMGPMGGEELLLSAAGRLCRHMENQETAQ